MFRAALLIKLFLFSSGAGAVVETRLGLSGTGFASPSLMSESVMGRADFELGYRTGEIKTQPRFETRFISFYENTALGDFQFDLDPIVGRFHFENSKLWMGRTHPVAELGLAAPSYYSALGSQWVQNQGDALTPRVSGWIGFGYQRKVFDWNTVLSYSPVFIPTMGPRLELSEDQPVTGARYSRFPPLYVDLGLGDQYFPLRYRVETGDLSRIVFQHQLFLGAVKKWSSSALTLAAWSSPSPSPEIDSSGVLKVVNDSVHVRVTAKPRFPRENHFGVNYSWRGRDRFHSALGVVFSDPASRVTLSGESGYLFLSVGFLHRVLLEPLAPSPVISPQYADRLVWIGLSGRFSDSFRSSFRFEHHLTPGAEGSWFRPRIEFDPDKSWSVFAEVNLLAGQDQSYFGTWRAFDSYSLGASFLW